MKPNAPKLTHGGGQARRLPVAVRWWRAFAAAVTGRSRRVQRMVRLRSDSPRLKNQDKSEPAENPAEEPRSPLQIEDVIMRISRALPDASHQCLRLVSKASRPAGAVCPCPWCATERQLIREKRLGPSWNVVDGYIFS